MEINTLFTILCILSCIFIIFVFIVIGLIMVKVSNNQKDTEGVENILDVYNSNISESNSVKEWKYGDFS